MVNVAARIAIMEDGQELPVTNAFDEDGDECDPEDAVAWGVSADDSTNVASPYARTSTGGVGVTALSSTDFFIFENGTGVTLNFNPGDIFLTNFPVDETVTINFATAIRGFGAYLTNNDFGAFTTTLDAYGAGDVLFGSATLGGTSSGTADGSALFIGLLSSLKDVVRVDVSVSDTNGLSSFGIGELALVTSAPPSNEIPEPSTVALVSLSLAGLALLRRRA